jgi:hypothetical protein
MNDKRVHFAKGRVTETMCHIGLSSQVKISDTWSKVTCGNCKKLANAGWKSMS